MRNINKKETDKKQLLANKKNNQRAQLTSTNFAITLVFVTELSPPPVRYRVFPATFDNILRKKFNNCAYRYRRRPFAICRRVLKALRVDNALIVRGSRHNKCPSGAELELFYKRTAITWQITDGFIRQSSSRVILEKKGFRQSWLAFPGGVLIDICSAKGYGFKLFWSKIGYKMWLFCFK